MKIKVIKTKYVLTKEEVELDIPENPVYFFIYGWRKSVAAIPEFVKMPNDKYELYRYKIVVVGTHFENIIEELELTLSDLVNIEHEGLKQQIVDYLTDSHHRYNEMIRTKERFINDYNKAVTNFNSILYENYKEIFDNN